MSWLNENQASLGAALWAYAEQERQRAAEAERQRAESARRRS